MKNIICSAQPFGYGPCSKLVNIVKKTRKISKIIQFDFIGEDIALTYARDNNVFNKIYDLGCINNIKKNKYNRIVSVMDPRLVIWGFINKIDTIYIDSLYWYWNWKNDYLPKVQEVIYKLEKTNDYQRALKILNGLEPHHQQYIGHYFSSKSYVQFFLNNGNNKKNDRYRRNIHPLTVRPIIDNSRKKNRDRNEIVISLAGFLSPLNREKEAIEYFKFINKLFEDIHEIIPKDVKILCTANPKIKSFLSKVSSNFKMVSYNNDELLDALNRALVIFTPAGITTTYEALEYNVPIAFLPEQHDGHYQNYLRITRTIPSSKNRSRIFPNLLINNEAKKKILDDPDSEINRIKNFIEGVNNGEHAQLVEKLKKQLQEMICKVFEEKDRNWILKNQRKVVFSVMEQKGFDFKEISLT